MSEPIESTVPSSPPSSSSDEAYLRAQLDQLQALLAQEREAVLTERRAAALYSAAETLRAADPADVVAWAARESPDAFAALLDSSGAVNPSAARALVQACKRARPHFFRSSAPGTPSNRRAAAPALDPVQHTAGRRVLFKL